MDISLTPELEKMVAERMATGIYETQEQVLRAGLLTLGSHEAKPRFLYSSEAELREKINEGVASLAQGQISPRSWDELKAEARTRHEAQRERSQS